MKKKTWADALDHLSAEYITEAMPKRTAKGAQIGKERHMKKDISIIRIVTGFAATAAVVALVAGSVVLISSMNNKVRMQPGQEGSSASDTADTTAAATTTASQEQTTPAVNLNFLGGTGELVPFGRSGNGSPVILHDAENWYTYPTAENTLPDHEKGYYSLISDGDRLYYPQGNDLCLIDSSGTLTPFFSYTGEGTMQYDYVTPIGTCADVSFRDSDPWYCIGGQITDKDTAVPAADYVSLSHFLVAFQPATGKTLSLTELMESTGMVADFTKVQCNLSSLYLMSCDGKSFIGMPHPGALMSDYAALDWAPQVYTVPMECTVERSTWTASNDTFDFVCADDNGIYACRFWRQDGAFEKNAISTAIDGYSLTDAFYTYRMVYVQGKLLVASAATDGKSGAYILRSYDAKGFGEKTEILLAADNKAGEPDHLSDLRTDGERYAFQITELSHGIVTYIYDADNQLVGSVRSTEP